MALHFQKRTTPFGSFTDISPDAEKIHSVRLQYGYNKPARLTFVVQQAQHTDPIGLKNFIRFWDDAGTHPITAGPFDVDNPTFEGYVEEVTPGENANEINVTCYDPTRKAANEVMVMSEPYTAGTVPGTPPPEGTGAIPRLVFNSKIDNDDDFMWERLGDETLNQIIRTLFDECYHPLYWASAAYGDGTSAGNGSAYEASDFGEASGTVGGAGGSFNYKPQEKIVFESENIHAAVMNLMQYEPAFRLIWHPMIGTAGRKWRFHDITQSPQTTLTLNEFDGTLKVLSLDLDRSLEGRFTAVKFYGPPAFDQLDITVSGGGLTNISSGPTLDTFGAGGLVMCQNRWQITDSTKRKVMRFLPQLFYAPQEGSRWGSPSAGFYTVSMHATPSRSPTFMVRYRGDTRNGTGEWLTVEGWQLDAKNGIINFEGHCVFRYNANPPVIGGILQPNVENPIDARFVYATPANTITARYPTSGYAGTAYSVAGLESELKLYDEMLAIAYEYGVPYTSAARVAQYEELARRIHAMRSDLIYTGGCTLDGLQYEFLFLNKRINFAAVDENGDTLVTGWENINAFLTEVEYDYEESLTTLQFSSDQMEEIGIDIEQQKNALKIRALIPVYWGRTSVTANKRRSFTAFGTPVIGADVSIEVQGGRVFVDPETGLPG